MKHLRNVLLVALLLLVAFSAVAQKKTTVRFLCVEADLPKDFVDKFMADYVKRHREPAKHCTVPITVDHLLAVPEGIIVVPAIMHCGIESESPAVDRAAVEHPEKEIIGGAELGKAMRCYVRQCNVRRGSAWNYVHWGLPKI